MVSQTQPVYGTGVLVLRLDEEVVDMVRRAERVKVAWERSYQQCDKNDKKQLATHVRNINALRGVVKGLHWVLGRDDSPLS